jgi:S-adenosylmethionine decarboxylase proenzyme
MAATAFPPFSQQGFQWLADLYQCQANTLIADALTLQHACLQLVTASGLTIVGERFYQFDPVGVTGVVLLAESHLAIHTWPEHGFVSIDLYVCHFSQDNQSKGEQLLATLIDYFQSLQPRIQRIARGTPPELV